MKQTDVYHIAKVIGNDQVYHHFSAKIDHEFVRESDKSDATLFVLFSQRKHHKVGFCVLGFSPAKMKMWNQVFREEGWVSDTYHIDEKSLELMYIYVAPEWRQHGIGTTLFCRALKLARKKKVKNMYAYVSDRSTTVLDFYLKMNARFIADLSDGNVSTAFIHWPITKNPGTKRLYKK